MRDDRIEGYVWGRERQATPSHRHARDRLRRLPDDRFSAARRPCAVWSFWPIRGPDSRLKPDRRVNWTRTIRPFDDHVTPDSMGEAEAWLRVLRRGDRPELIFEESTRPIGWAHSETSSAIQQWPGADTSAPSGK